jgi:hypothetical protein
LSCIICSHYKDARPEGKVDADKVGSPCKYVPAEDKCFTDDEIEKDDMVAETSCDTGSEVFVRLDNTSENVSDIFNESETNASAMFSKAKYNASANFSKSKYEVYEVEPLLSFSKSNQTVRDANGSCEELQTNASCEVCNKYSLDGSSNGSQEEGSQCKYVPALHKCMSEFRAKNESMIADDSCLKESAQLRNDSDVNCWDNCGQKGGKCAWCGTRAACCRKGWDDDPAECNGASGWTGREGHQCVLIKT